MPEFVHTPLRKRLVYAFDLAGEYAKAPKGKNDPMARRPTTLEDFYSKYSAKLSRSVATKVFKEKIGEILDDGGWEWISHDRDMMMKPYMNFMVFIKLIAVFFPSSSKRTKINCTVFSLFPIYLIQNQSSSGFLTIIKMDQSISMISLTP